MLEVWDCLPLRGEDDRGIGGVGAAPIDNAPAKVTEVSGKLLGCFLRKVKYLACDKVKRLLDCGDGFDRVIVNDNHGVFAPLRLGVLVS